MWSKDSQLYILTWVGTIAGLLGVVLSILAIVHPAGFPVSPSELAYMAVSALIVGAISLGIWRTLRTAISRPDVETLEIVKKLVIKDKTGNDAVLTRTQMDRANRKVASHTLTVGGLSVTGAITEIKIDGEVIPQTNWERVVNDWRVTRTKFTPLQPGTTIARVVETKIADSFPKKIETLSHEVSQHTAKLVMEITFPIDRKPSNVSAYLAFGNQAYEALPAPTRNSDGTIYTFTTANPQLGGSYKLEWEW